MTGGNTVLAGSIPVREELSNTEVVGYHRTYSCNYGFQQEFTSLSAFPNGLDDRFYSGQVVGMLPFYLIQASNENGVVRSTTTSVPVPDNFDWEQAVQSTNNPVYQDFFIHFPEGPDGGTGLDPDDSGSIRNPLVVCRDINNLCS